MQEYLTKGRWCGLAFSRDGKFLASCNEETKRVTIWNVGTGDEGRSWEVPSVSRVSTLSPQGQILATGHDDGSIILWDSATGQKKRALAGHSAPIRSLKFTPDGKTLVSSGNEGIIRLWNPEIVRALEVIPSDRPIGPFSSTSIPREHTWSRPATLRSFSYFGSPAMATRFPLENPRSDWPPASFPDCFVLPRQLQSLLNLPPGCRSRSTRSLPPKARALRRTCASERIADDQNPQQPAGATSPAV